MRHSAAEILLFRFPQNWGIGGNLLRAGGKDSRRQEQQDFHFPVLRDASLFYGLRSPRQPAQDNGVAVSRGA